MTDIDIHTDINWCLKPVRIIFGGSVQIAFAKRNSSNKNYLILGILAKMSRLTFFLNTYVTFLVFTHSLQLCLGCLMAGSFGAPVCVCANLHTSVSTWRRKFVASDVFVFAAFQFKIFDCAEIISFIGTSRSAVCSFVDIQFVQQNQKTSENLKISKKLLLNFRQRKQCTYIVLLKLLSEVLCFSISSTSRLVAFLKRLKCMNFEINKY